LSVHLNLNSNSNSNLRSPAYRRDISAATEICARYLPLASTNHSQEGNLHTYTTRLLWTGSTDDYTTYSRDHDVRVERKPVLRCSADAAFRGAAGLHNPEDLFISAIASCHMLSYLALCARRGVRVIAYADEARGTLTLAANGGGGFTDVRLSPVVHIAEGSDAALALRLHEEAHARCFIARSCSVPIHCDATIETKAGGRAPREAIT
jgi:organic hydroperoxide reductase OsmC/OhrA